MNANRLHPHDNVRIELLFDDRIEDAYQGSGDHNIGEAILAAFNGNPRKYLNIEDFVFAVTDLTTGTSGRYRVNAGGNITHLS